MPVCVSFVKKKCRSKRLCFILCAYNAVYCNATMVTLYVIKGVHMFRSWLELTENETCEQFGIYQIYSIKQALYKQRESYTLRTNMYSVTYIDKVILHLSLLRTI